MELDIKTLSFILLITFFVQVIAFLLMIFTVKNYKGITLWATGVFFLTLGFGTMFLRSYVDNNGLLIFSTNLFHIGGLLIFYIGSTQFLDHHKKSYFLISCLVLFLLFICYYTFINDFLKARFILYSAAEVSFLFINAWLLLKYSKKAYQKAAIFVSTIFILDSLFFLYRIIYYLFNHDPYLDFFSIDGLQSLTMLISICAGLLWTFGLIIIVSQRLNGELTE